jgi:hypothetical protein
MLVNTPKIPTWQSKTGQQSIIDLTFINTTTLNNAIIKNGKSIMKSHSTTSLLHGTLTKENNAQTKNLQTTAST